MDKNAPITARLEQAEYRLTAIAIRLTTLELRPEERIQFDLLKRGIPKLNFCFFRVPSEYYSFPLQQRALLLGCHRAQLCKTILFENTLFDEALEEDQSYPRYCAVVVQYVAKVNAATLRTHIHELRPVEARVSKKKINFQLVSDEQSLALSGFEHNAVTPFGFSSGRAVPIILCEACIHAARQQGFDFIYLGGGEVDLKLRLSLSALVGSGCALVADVSDPR